MQAAGASGRDLIDAVVLSLDVGTRIFVAMGRRKIWLATHQLRSNMCFALEAAVAAGRVLARQAAYLGVMAASLARDGFRATAASWKGVRG